MRKVSPLASLLGRLRDKATPLSRLFRRRAGLFPTNLRSFQIFFLYSFLQPFFCTFIHGTDYTAEVRGKIKAQTEHRHVGFKPYHLAGLTSRACLIR